MFIDNLKVKICFEMEHMYAPFSTYDMNMLLSAHSSASQFTGAVFLFQCSPNAHTISCPFHCL